MNFSLSICSLSLSGWRSPDEDKCCKSLPFQRCCPLRPVGSYFSLTIVWWCDFVSLSYRYIPNVSHHPSSSSVSPYSSLSFSLSFSVAKDTQGRTFILALTSNSFSSVWMLWARRIRVFYVACIQNNMFQCCSLVNRTELRSEVTIHSLLYYSITAFVYIPASPMATEGAPGSAPPLTGQTEQSSSTSVGFSTVALLSSPGIKSSNTSRPNLCSSLPIRWSKLSLSPFTDHRESRRTTIARCVAANVLLMLAVNRSSRALWAEYKLCRIQDRLDWDSQTGREVSQNVAIIYSPPSSEKHRSQTRSVIIFPSWLHDWSCDTQEPLMTSNPHTNVLL